MKVLIVCSGTEGFISPFIKEQMDSLIELGLETRLYKITKKGFGGYLSNLYPLVKFLKKYKPDIIHAHYGLSGLLANLQRKVPVITTFHGCDINNKRILKFSKLAYHLSAGSIFVNEAMMYRLGHKSNSFNIPCGVDTSIFTPMAMDEARKLIGIRHDEIVILFSSYFNNPVKNYSLAKDACLELERILNREIKVIELKGHDRVTVSLLMNSANCALLTSFSEGSPQFIKEAMSCNCPVVSTNVGDVHWLLGNTDGCYITDFDPKKIAERIGWILEFGQRTNGRDRIINLNLDNSTVAHKIANIYTRTLSN